MATNTNDNDINNICDKIERIFNELNISFEKVDLNDEDANYIISFSSSNAALSSIQSLNIIEGLLYIDSQDLSLNFLSFNVYQIKNVEDLNYYYELVNDINGFINHGKFIINKDPYCIIYRAVIDYEEDHETFSRNLIQNIIDDFLDNLSALFVLMKRKGAINA